jgi:hypothetical protein
MRRVKSQEEPEQGTDHHHTELWVPPGDRGAHPALAKQDRAVQGRRGNCCLLLLLLLRTHTEEGTPKDRGPQNQIPFPRQARRLFGGLFFLLTDFPT